MDLPLMELPLLSLPTPVALGAIAVLGYVLGRRNRTFVPADVDQARRELKRAQAVAQQLETIAETIRKSLAVHHSSITRFKDRVNNLSGDQQESDWQDLCQEAEEMLQPTLRLAAHIASAYDEIRQQSNHLMTFTEVRTDPLTRVSNRRALDETLENMVAMLNRYQQMFAVLMIDIDHFKKINDEHGHLYGDQALQSLARAIDQCARETDIVSRFGGEEFVVVMPHTNLEGASAFSERLRQTIAESLSLTISGGVAAARDGETPQDLLARADAALYAAKASGRNRIHRHQGDTIQPVSPGAPAAPASPSASGRIAALASPAAV